MCSSRTLLIGLALLAVLLPAGCAAGTGFQAYAKPGELDPLPEGAASLYKAPWRASVRTVSAHEALQGIGVYYKHIPHWTEQQHTDVMKQMAAAGVKRLRLAPHHALYIHKDWTAPSKQELERIRWEFRACKAAGIRPCVTFVHIPPAGKPGSDELEKWFKRNWNKGLAGLVPVDEIGTPSWNAYLEKTYLSLSFVLKEGRAAGFAEPGSYDLEMGQNIWWGAPAIRDPWPSLTLKELRPGGRFYEFDRALIQRARKEGYKGPTFWWAETHHLFEKCVDEEVPPECAGRACSFYTQGIGPSTKEWFKKALDTWPVPGPMRFLEGAPPEMVLARPEGWIADRSRHDNMISLMRRSKTPIAVTSLGVVPREISGYEQSALNGWQIKQRALTRSLAFWLNQGAAFVLIHSAYEGGRGDGGKLEHSLIPGPIKDTKLFRWQDAPPLVTMRAFCDGLAGAKPIKDVRQLSFRYSVKPDPVIIPRTGKAGPMRASDLVALLPFQVDGGTFAVAAYVLTPNIAETMEPVRITLEVDALVVGTATTLRPYDGSKGKAKFVSAKVTLVSPNPAPHIPARSTWQFDLHDDVTWVRFKLE